MTALTLVEEKTKAGPEAQHIMSMLLSRQQSRNPAITQMKLVRDVYNTELVIPLPAIDKTAQPAVANVLKIGLDQMGMRVGEVLPDIWYPPLDANERNASSMKRARERRMANLAWWQANRMPMKLRRRARQLGGYGLTAVTIRADFKRGIPLWHVRDPLATYAAPGLDPDEITPPDTIYTFTRSWQWLKDHYHDDVVGRLETAARGNNSNECDKDTLFDMVEYVDEEVTVLLVQGKGRPGAGSPSEFSSATSTYLPWVELERIPNRAGICPSVVAGRINLDRPGGMFDGIVGMYVAQARLVGLEMLAVERAIYPDTYLIGENGMTPRFVAGPHEGRTGRVNIVTNGRLEQVRLDPSQSSLVMGDRLERAQRAEGAVPPEYSGESATNVRTGKRGDAILSATVDHHVYEAQEILGGSLYEENVRAIAYAKAYFGAQKKSFFISIGTNVKPGHYTYTANETFAEGDHHVVSYPAMGADQNAIVVAAGQRIGLGTMSHQTFMEMDPQVQDPTREMERIRDEQLEDALMQSLQQRVGSGALPPTHMTMIMDEFRKDHDLVKAVQRADEQVSAKQATPAPGPDTPEAQPGLADPGTGAEQPTGPTTVQPPTAGIQNRADLVRALAAGMPRRGA